MNAFERRDAVEKIAQLVAQKIPKYEHFAKTYENEWGLATYVACAAAKVVGSKLKPRPIT